ncbi:pentatricopeptide repeat-containing protein At4g19440, chloroplastic [Brassica rapa]|uniref:pentatricopeptide repeat-containing protein At4g19440, chloroplastic n=1 Tax=Brassica campestris TaxID=3711 RepID=UPI00142DD763|nr:pentatricopeptide repeat-containing protein At4g19440, chloroplastic [Brassica rapa]
MSSSPWNHTYYTNTTTTPTVSPSPWNQNYSPYYKSPWIYQTRTIEDDLDNSLIRSFGSVAKCCEVFEVVCKGVSPYVYLFTKVINAFCKRGRVEEGIKLLVKMEEAGVVPNVVTYNTVIDGLGVIGRYDEAFMFKEKMVENGVEPTLVTYSVLVKGLIKAKRIW